MAFRRKANLRTIRERHRGRSLRVRTTFMNGSDLLRIVDLMHREKNIPKEIIFEGIEAAVQLAAQKHYGEEDGIAVTIDRESGEIKAQRGEGRLFETVA